MVISNLEQNTLFTAEEVAYTLGIRKAEAYELFKTSSFPAFKIGNRYFVTGKALLEWLKNTQCKNTGV